MIWLKFLRCGKQLHKRPSFLGEYLGVSHHHAACNSQLIKKVTYIPQHKYIYRERIWGKSQSPYPNLSTASLHSSKYYQEFKASDLKSWSILEPPPIVSKHTICTSPGIQGGEKQRRSLLRTVSSARGQAAVLATVLAKTLPFLSKGRFCESPAGLLQPGEALKERASQPAIFSFSGELTERTPRGT